MNALSDPLTLGALAVAGGSAGAIGLAAAIRSGAEMRLFWAAVFCVVLSPVARHSSILWGQFFVRGGDFDSVRGGALVLAAVSLAFLAVGLIMAWPYLAEDAAQTRREMSEGLLKAPLYPLMALAGAGGVVIGIAAGNDIRQLASHSLNLFQPALQVAVVYCLARRLERSRVMALMDALALTFAAAGVVNSLSSLLIFGSFTSAAGGPISALPIIYAAARFRLDELADPRRMAWWAFLMATGLLTLVASFKRAAWVGGGLAVVILLAMLFLQADWRRPETSRGSAFALCALVLVGIAGAAFVGNSAQAIVQAALTDRLQRIDTDELGDREVEVKFALEDLDRQPDLAWVVGRGSGAQYFHPSYGPGWAQIHITPIAILQRYGLAGVALFAIGVLATLYLLWLALPLSEWVGRAAFGYFISSLVFTFSAFTITWDHVLAAIAAAALALAASASAQRKQA